MDFKTILSQGKVIVKKTYTRGDKSYVQFIQLVSKGNSISSSLGHGKTTVTTNLPIGDISLKKNYDYQANDEIVFAKDLFQEENEMNIMVVENTIPNNENHSPRTSFKTGNVLKYAGKPVYRHTKLVVGEVLNVFLNYDFSFEEEDK